MPSPSATLTPVVEEAMAENLLLQKKKNKIGFFGSFMDRECKKDKIEAKCHVPRYNKAMGMKITGKFGADWEN